MAQETQTEPKFRPARASELKPGVRVEYRGSWGRGLPQDGVISFGPEFEGDELVWGVELDHDAHPRRWGYLGQFKVVEAR